MQQVDLKTIQDDENNEIGESQALVEATDLDSIVANAYQPKTERKGGEKRSTTVPPKSSMMNSNPPITSPRSTYRSSKDVLG